MLEKHVIFPFSSLNYMFSVNYIFLLNIAYVFAIITCLGFLVSCGRLGVRCLGGSYQKTIIDRQTDIFIRPNRKNTMIDI